MKQLPSILLVSYIALTLGGCGLFPNSEESSEDPPVAESPQPSENKPDQVFEDPGASPDISQVSAADGLIPSTSPSERKNAIQTGRDNPFAVIPIQPVIRQKTASNGVAEPEKLCQLEEVKQPQPPTTVAQAPAAAVPVSDVQLPPLLDPILPIPNEARAVVVSGVLQLNGTPVAIVKAPNENVARQVTVGASLSNGQVRVKAINVNSQSPYIVLEQYGLEIPRGVGEPAEEPVQPPEPPTPVLPDGTPQPEQPVAAKPSIPPPGPNGFGKVKDIVLLQLSIKDTRATGIICNAGFKTLNVKVLTLQVEDKQSGTVLDSFEVGLGSTYILQSAQKAVFEGNTPELRGRKQGDVNIKLLDWRS